MTSDRGAIECVVFDVGGIIVRHTRSWPEAHVRAGFDADAPVLELPGFLALRKTLAMDHQTGRLSSEDYPRAVAEHSGGAYTPDDVVRILDVWLIDEYTGVDTLIEDLLATGITTAALSNTNPRHWRRVTPRDDGSPPEFPTTARLHHLVASHEVRAAKPEPAIYAALESTTGLDGDALLFFDDLQDNIDAARARGWHAELIDHAGDPPAEMRALLTGYGVLTSQPVHERRLNA